MRKVIYVVSDGTGETAERVARATVLQFNYPFIDFRVFGRVLNPPDIDEVMAQAERDQPFIFYTMVNPEHRELLRAKAQERGFDCADIIGSLMVKLSSYLGQKPLLEPGLGHEMDEDYFRRVDAVEFAVKNDDGQEPKNMFKADVVLVGLSRTSKTPLSIYLAHKGWKVANVPLVKGVNPPAELNAVPSEKIYALSIGLDALVKIRRARLRHLGLSEASDYATRESVHEEIKWVQEIYAAHPEWPVLDVTNRAIEETAAEILKVHESRKR